MAIMAMMEATLDGARADLTNAIERVRGLAATYSSPDLFTDSIKALERTRAVLGEAKVAIKTIQATVDGLRSRVEDQDGTIAKLTVDLEAANTTIDELAQKLASGDSADTAPDAPVPPVPAESTGKGTNTPPPAEPPAKGNDGVKEGAE